jgi:hypothetical protein
MSLCFGPILITVSSIQFSHHIMSTLSSFLHLNHSCVTFITFYYFEYWLSPLLHFSWPVHFFPYILTPLVIKCIRKFSCNLPCLLSRLVLFRNLFSFYEWRTTNLLSPIYCFRHVPVVTTISQLSKIVLNHSSKPHKIAFLGVPSLMSPNLLGHPDYVVAYDPSCTVHDLVQVLTQSLQPSYYTPYLQLFLNCLSILHRSILSLKSPHGTRVTS